MSEPHADLPDDSEVAQPEGTCPFGPGSPFAAYYCPPRLGIIHLLAWTAATAVLLKFSMAMEMSEGTTGPSLPVPMEVARKTLQFVWQAAYGAGIVAAGILVVARFRRQSGRLQPGHWLVLVETVALLLWISCWGVYQLMLSAGTLDQTTARWSFGLYGAAGMVHGGMCVYATLALKDSKRWKTCFGALAIVNLMQGLSYVAAWLVQAYGLLISFPLGSFLVGPALLTVLALDLRRGPRRDWLHWVGVGMIATDELVSVGWWVWSMFANRMMQ